MAKNQTPTTDTKDLSAIDQALAQAQAKVAAKEPEAPKEKPAKVDDAEAKAKKEAEKAAKAAARAVARAEKKAAQEAARAEKKAAREAKKAEREAAKANKGPAHLSKVAKAAAKLPALTENGQAQFKRVMKALSQVEVMALAQHLLHALREKATIAAAAGVKLTEGQLVRITGGAPKFIGQVATMFKVQRIRCYVTVEGVDKPIYLFTSDVEPVAAADAETCEFKSHREC
jgi:hypothetical protein